MNPLESSSDHLHQDSSRRVDTPHPPKLPVEVVAEEPREVPPLPQGKIQLMEQEPTLLMRIARVLDNTLLGNVLSFAGLVHILQPTPNDKFRALYIRLRYGRSLEAGRMTQTLQNAVSSQNISLLQKAIKNAQALEMKCRKDYQAFSNLGSEIMAKLSASQTDDARITISSIQKALQEPLFPNYLSQEIGKAAQELERLHGFSKGQPQMSLIDHLYLLSASSNKVRICSEDLLRAFPRRRINSLEFGNALKNYREARAQFLSIKEQIQSRIERRLEPSSYIAPIMQPFGTGTLDKEALETLWDEAELEHANNIIRETDLFLKENGVDLFIIQAE